MTLTSSSIFIITVIGLFSIGIYGLMAIRNMIKAIVALQLMVKGAMLAFVLAGNINGNVQQGASMALTVIVADTIVAVIGMALAVQVRKHIGTLDIKALTKLKR